MLVAMDRCLPQNGIVLGALSERTRAEWHHPLSTVPSEQQALGRAGGDRVNKLLFLHLVHFVR